jgi:hypothetical protein
MAATSLPAGQPPSPLSEPAGGFSAEVLAIADRFGVRHLLPTLYREAQRLFPGPIEMQVEWDPEIPDHPKIAFESHTSHDVEECLALQRIWISRVLELAGPHSLLFVLTPFTMTTE